MSEHTWSQPAVGAVLLEALVPLLDGVLVVSGVRPEEVKVLLGQALLALDTAHFCVRWWWWCVFVGGDYTKFSDAEATKLFT